MNKDTKDWIESIVAGILMVGTIVMMTLITGLVVR